MLVRLLLILFVILKVNSEDMSEKRFANNFLFGASTSAYQIEGGWNSDGKGESMWDYYLHKQPDIDENSTNGDIAADSYHFYEQDVELLKHLGAKSYRFSLSWPRILPDGTTDNVNPLGIAYYDRLIDLLIANDILPLVTIYHWDLPIALSDQGGWLNETTTDIFAEFTRVVFEAFGDRVKHWITINEPFMHCYKSYGLGIFPPLVKSPGNGFYDCGRNLVLAHAKAYRVYDEEFRISQGGRVGITLDVQWPLAASDSRDDMDAVDDYLAFHLGQYMDPIFKGDYPQRLIKRISAASQKQGLPNSRFQSFNEEEKMLINGTADFVGINHYHSLYVYRNESVTGKYDVPSFEDDAGVGSFIDPAWPKSSISDMTDYAPGFYSLLLHIKDNYNNPIVIVTENGFPLTADEDLQDGKKVHYIRGYLDALLEAKAAGSNCQGYFIWSLIDTYEWVLGYRCKFGLYQVDYNDPSKRRTARKSALVYKEIIRSGTIDFCYNPDPYKYMFSVAGTYEEGQAWLGPSGN